MSSGMWPDETPDEVVARIRREHGDAIADLVARDMAAAPSARKKRVPERVGNKEVRRMALGQGLVPKQGVAWDEGGVPIGPLPRSGAGRVPKARPRTSSERKGRA